MATLHVVGIGLVTFLSTSVDNLGTLVLFFAASEARPRAVCAGYLATACGVGAVAWATSQLSLFIPPAWLGYLGIVPIGLGLRSIRGLRRSGPGAVAPPKASRAWDVALVTAAQSADNLVVYAALFADSAARLDPILFATLAAAAALWCGLGFWLGRRSPLAGSLQRAARFVLPVLLIAVGAYICLDTATDVAGASRAGFMP